MTTTDTDKLEKLIKFLKLHQVSRAYKPAVYALTPSTLAITVQRQQIRALNLVHAIYETWNKHQSLQNVPCKKDAKVAIIGGGIAGVTAAGGLLKKGFEVHLFEQRSELCHLQSGCETRWLHPSIYDWPAPNSDFSDARLPLLNWSAGTAGQVTRYIMKQFRVIINESKKNDSNGKYNQYLRANARVVKNRLHWDNADLCDKKTQGDNFLGRGGSANFDVIIIAVGFGVERGVLDPNHNSTSYWRNDHFGQPRPWSRSERQVVVCISGDGDGGLLDLIRVCLQGFKHDRIVDDLFAEQELLLNELEKIRNQHLENLKNNKKDSLIEPFKELYKQNTNPELKQQVDEVKKLIEERIRTDTRAILNGRSPSFAEILRVDGRSFFNVFLCYTLYHLEAFSYVGGAGIADNPESVDIEGYGHLECDVCIRRHGTERKSVLEAVGLTSNEVDGLFKKQRPHDLKKYSERIWEPGWWSLPPEQELSTEGGGSGTEPEWLERVPRLEQALAIAFLTPLCEKLKDLNSMNGCKFRLTLHRTIHFKTGEEVDHCYQQIAQYFGTADDRITGKPGRVYPTEPSHEKCGAVGVTIREGVSFVSQLPNEKHDEKLNKWKKLWDRLILKTTDKDGVPHHRNMNPELVTTIVTVPVYARLNEEKKSVRFIFYIDVEHNRESKVRPDCKDLLKLLLATSRGVVESVKSLRKAEHDDLRLLSVRSAVRDTKGIEIKTSSNGVSLENFSWLQTDYADLVQIQQHSGIAYELPDIDELELHAEG